MRRDLCKYLACPKCYGSLELLGEKLKTCVDPAMGASFEVVLQGDLVCLKCGITYPIRFDVAGLAVIDQTWAPALNELISRRLIVQHALPPMPVTPEPEHPKSAPVQTGPEPSQMEDCVEIQRQRTASVMENLFSSALPLMPLSPQSMVLDVGAGLAETSHVFAKQGAKVIALETEISNLFHFDFRCTAWRKAPILYDYYFSRVFANIHRIPFASDTFDATFCRSVLHHVNDIPAAIREMARVTKPGGMIMLCSEPVRGIFESESLHLRENVDRHHGLNEHHPVLFTYLRGLRHVTRGVRILYDPTDSSRITMLSRIFNRLTGVKAGDWVPAASVWKLLPFSYGTNIVAVKKAVAMPYPSGRKVHYPNFMPLEIIEIYTADASGDLASGTARLMRLRRKVLRDAPSIPSKMVMASVRSEMLNRGFTEPLSVRERTVRATLRDAGVTLRKPSAKAIVSISLVPISDSAYHADLYVNETLRGHIHVDKPAVLSFDVSDICEPIIDIVILCHDFFPLKIGYNCSLTLPGVPPFGNPHACWIVL